MVYALQRMLFSPVTGPLQEHFGAVDQARDETERSLRAHVAELEVRRLLHSLPSCYFLQAHAIRVSYFTFFHPW